MSSLTGNSIKSVELVVHFEIPDALLQDKTRFSVIDAGTYDLVKTWSNTQSGLFYMSSGWSIEIQIKIIGHGMNSQILRLTLIMYRTEALMTPSYGWML